MRKTLKATLCLLLLFGQAGCIKENTDDCPRAVLTLYYDADGERNVIGEYIHGAVLYVFDHGELVVQRPVSASEITSGHGISFILPAGNYHVVCWGNMDEYSRPVLTDGGPDRCRLQHAAMTGAGRIETFDPLYHAAGRFALADKTTTSHRLDFHSAHIGLDFYIRGFGERYPVAGDPELRLTGIETGYDFAKNASRTPGAVCYPVVKRDAAPGVHTAQLNVLRFDEDTPMEIGIRIPGGEEVFHLRMAELLTQDGDATRRTPSVSLDREELRIPISVDFTGNRVDVAIEIPDWVEEPIRPGI
ncbi:FimB/Mfa2 family fimbrial subunit [Rikenella microfusus]|uniref:FimB/Mfa2 family fimbrial subunit n=1 Tax=Rikenella microfusus TaxID=28139 RepID=UPI002357328E|nr:FimB/Mfa2 family fimbrial subunit [Rikenella microfusus]